MSAYPIALEGETVRALVVGGGPVAVRKVRGLRASGARVQVLAREAVDELRALARDDDGVSLRLGDYEASAIAGTTLVIAATDDAEVNAMIAADARRAGRLVNVVDAPERGTFTTPAVHRSGDLVIAVSAGVPSAAARIRDAIGARFGVRYAEVLTALRALRTKTLDEGDSARWRAANDSLVDDGFCEDVESGALRERIASWR